MNDLWFEMEEQYFESTKGIGTLGIMGWKNDFEVFFFVDSTGPVLLGEATYLSQFFVNEDAFQQNEKKKRLEYKDLMKYLQELH